jgi:hypothetical protein
MATQAMAWAAMRCARTRGDLVARFVREGDQWQLAEATPVDESVDSGEARLEVAGSFGLAPGYEGCPGCQASSYVRCDSCGSLSCWTGDPAFTCGWCGTNGQVNGRIQAIDAVDGG